MKTEFEHRFNKGDVVYDLKGNTEATYNKPFQIAKVMFIDGQVFYELTTPSNIRTSIPEQNLELYPQDTYLPDLQQTLNDLAFKEFINKGVPCSFIVFREYFYIRRNDEKWYWVYAIAHNIPDKTKRHDLSVKLQSFLYANKEMSNQELLEYTFTQEEIDNLRDYLKTNPLSV